MSVKTLVGIAVFLLIAAFASAQATLGILKGRVLDETAAVIPGTQITVSAGRFTRSVASGPDGSFTIVGIPTGLYTVKAASPGMSAYINANVQISAGGTTNLDISLKVGAEAQQVTVQDSTTTQVSTDPSSNAGALVLRGEDLAALPDDPDDLAADLQALAGPAAGPNGGQIFIDGFTGGRMPPKESIREIRINQNPFSAEYDRLGFGRIEIFTKPGSDKYRGSASFDISDSVFNSRNPFSATKAPFQSKTYSGNFSGPLSKRASFFLDYERRDSDDNAVINATILDAAFNRITDAESIITPHLRQTFSPRIDYQLSTNVTLMGRYTYTNNDTPVVGPGVFALASQAYSTSGNQQSVQATETWVINAKAINETRFQYQKNRSTQASNNTGPNAVPTINVLEAFVGGGPTVGIGYNNSTLYEFQNYTSLSQGAHTFRFGGRARISLLGTAQQSNFNGTFTFAGGYVPELGAANQPTGNTIFVDSLEVYRRTLLHLPGGGPRQFSIANGNPVAGVDQTDIGVFAQDDWRVKPNLTLSLGLRYETQTNIHDWTDFAPRIGIAWAPGATAKNSRPKTVLRMGTGIFYDRFGENLVLSTIRFNGVNQQQYTITAPDPVLGLLDLRKTPDLSTLNAQVRPQTTRRLDSALRAPYIIQSAFGVERQLPRNTVLSVTFTNSRGLHMLRSRNINAPLPGSNALPFPGTGQLDLYESTGVLNQNQVNINVTTRVTARISMFGGYSFNRAYGNADGAGSFPANQYDMSSEYGRSSLDTRQRIYLSGSVEAPKAIRFSPFLMYHSPSPFNITTGYDNNGDQIFTDRPAFATAADIGKRGIVATRYGVFNTLPGPNDVLIPRNYFDGPGSFTVNLRISRSFAFGPERKGFAGTGSGFEGGRGGGGDRGSRGGGGGSRGGGGGGGMRMGGGGRGDGATTSNRRYSLNLSASARNLMNHTNPGNYTGNLTSPYFGLANSIGGGFRGGSANNRGIDFMMRFTF